MLFYCDLLSVPEEYGSCGLKIILDEWDSVFMNDRTFVEQFGLTEAEAQELCSRYTGVSYEELRWWYDGYLMEEQYIQGCLGWSGYRKI